MGNRPYFIFSKIHLVYELFSKDIKKAFSLLDSKMKKSFLHIVLLGFFYGLFEVFAISIFLPFVSLIISPNETKYIQSINQYIVINHQEMIIIFCCLIVFTYFIRIFFTMFNIYHLNKYTFELQLSFGRKLFEKFIFMSYGKYTNMKSSTLMQSIVSEASYLSVFINQFMIICIELITISIIYISLCIYDWELTFFTTVFMLIILFITNIFVGKTLKLEGEKRSFYQEKSYKLINEVFSNFKIIKIVGNEHEMISKFSSLMEKYIESNITANTIMFLPKIILEAIGFSFIAVIIIFLYFKNGSSPEVISTITFLALALYRLLPLINKVVSSYNNMKFYVNSVQVLYEDLKLPLHIENQQKEYFSDLTFNREIVLNNIVFSFNEHRVLNDITLKIKKGDRLAIIGQSGNGKTTLINIIMGLLKQDSGHIFIDSVELTEKNQRAWLNKIGYVPQSIYLFDGTVGENIAFGYKYDSKKIINALTKANIYNHFKLKNGIDTEVGEAGIQLSGGQKQRLGIARALYSEPEILILDEATSALDEKIENEIMEELYSLNKDITIIIISHKMNAINRCNRIFTIEKGIIQ